MRDLRTSSFFFILVVTAEDRVLASVAPSARSLRIWTPDLPKTFDAMTGEQSQLLVGVFWNHRGADESEAVEFGDPSGVVHVGFAAGYVFHVSSLSDGDVDSHGGPDIVDGFPVDAGGLYGNVFNPHVQ